PHLQPSHPAARGAPGRPRGRARGHAMSLDWLLRRFFLAFPVAFALFLLVNRYAVPAFVWNEYQAHTQVNVLEPPPVDEGAGSHDIYYLAASYDCEVADLWLVGEAPDADYWMVGIYDTRMRQIPSGHLNHRSIHVEDDGTFQIHITQRPTGAD